jgi:hypothetical protein
MQIHKIKKKIWAPSEKRSGKHVYILQAILNTSSIEDKQLFDADNDWNSPVVADP